MASPFHRARIRWMRDGELGPPEDHEVRTISDRAMFVKSDEPPMAGTRGEVDLLDDDGRPLMRAVIRIVFRKPGSGVGVEVLETNEIAAEPEERESSRPPPRFDKDGVEQRPPPSDRKPRPRRSRSRKPTAIGVGITAPPTGPEVPKPSAPKAAPKAPGVEPRSGGPTAAPPKRKRRSQKPTAVGVPATHPSRQKKRKGTLVGMASAAPPADAASSDAAASDAQLQSKRPDTGELPVLDLDSNGEIELPAPEAAGFEPVDRAPSAEASAKEEPKVTAAKPVDETLDAAESKRALSSLDELPDTLDLDLSEPPEEALADPLELSDEPQLEPEPQLELSDAPELELPELEPSDELPVPEDEDLLAAPPELELDEPEDEGVDIDLDAPSDEEPSVQVDSSLIAEARSMPPPKVREARVATRIRGKGKAVGVAIGIDLGTSNTCASAVISGRPQVIPTRWGTNTIPSILAFIDGKPMVGHAAAKRLILNPEETIYGSKRLIGRTYTSQMHDEYQPYFAYPLAETEERQFGAALPQRIISFEEVGQRLLAEVREVAEQHMGQEIGSVVVTVPAYFGETQREAVRRAARSAGLTVGRIVNEPTAAAVAYGYNHHDDATLVVFDLGGGTFDVSVLKVKEQRFEVLATGGDAFLGGIDVDDVLANYLLEEFLKIERVSLEPNSQQIARLREAAEECKRGLSMQHRFGVYLPHFATIDGKPRHLQVAVEQSTLTELTVDMCDRLIDITRDVLAENDMSPRDIDDVLLVGGATRLPQVQERVEMLFERRPSKRINPDEAVALGAALLSDKGGLVELVDVLPISIGYPGTGRKFIRLIGRNTTVPTTRAFIIPTTEEDQLELTMPLFQGERADVAENEYLGTVRVMNIPPGAKGSDIELTLALDAQCMLAIRAVHDETGIPLDVVIDREQGSDDLIASLGPYEGPKQEPEKERPKSALGRFFTKMRGLFKRK